MPGVEDFHSLRLRTTSESERDSRGGRTSLAGTPDRVEVGALRDRGRVELGVTEHRCLTCSSPILDNTTSTTSCVKCARLRTRRMNFAHPPPLVGMGGGGTSGGRGESSDSGVSSGSQECGDYVGCPPPTSTPLHPLQRQRDSAQFSTLVRKLSEVEGLSPSSILRSVKTSVDEGVEVDFPDSASTQSQQSSSGWTCDSQTSSVGQLSSSRSGSR